MNKFATIILVILGAQLITAQNLNKDVDCKCRSPVQSRIVGGEEVRHPIPWSASLMTTVNKNWTHQCGATILNSRWIMTSASCALPYRTFINDLIIRVGISDLSIPQNSSNTFKAKRIVFHNQYDSKNISTIGDISLIELDRPLEFNQVLQPACLSERVEKYSNTKLEAIGYGSTRQLVKSPYSNDGGKSSMKLKHAYFHVDESLDKKCQSQNGHLICLKPIRNPNKLFKDSICAKDMGSGLMYHKNGFAHVVGIAQFFTGEDFGRDLVKYCLGDSYFLRLSKMIPFIQNVIGNDYCSKN